MSHMKDEWAGIQDALEHRPDPRAHVLVSMHAEEITVTHDAGDGFPMLSIIEGPSRVCVHGDPGQINLFMDAVVRACGYDPAALYHHKAMEALLEREGRE